MPSKQSSKKAPKTKNGKTSSVKLCANELRIRFDHPNEVLPQLLALAEHFSEEHTSSLAENVENLLGGARARVIVANCTRSTAWLATLGELFLNLAVFRTCIASSVNAAGFVPPINIPATPETTLIQVVAAIQGSLRK
jgi:hypothetical protein